jgi:hypothetical protein
MGEQFSLRGMLMVPFPRRFTVNWVMRWLGFKVSPGDTDARRVFELVYLALKQSRVPLDTVRVISIMFSDDQLRAMRVPTLLLVDDTKSCATRQRRCPWRLGFVRLPRANWSHSPVPTCASASIESWMRGCSSS